MKENVERYYQSALNLGLPVARAPEVEGIKIQFGKKSYFFRASNHPFNYFVNADIANNKYSTNLILSNAGFPVPKMVAIGLYEYNHLPLEECIQGLNFPLVAKPTKNTSKGDDVLCNIQTIDELRDYLSNHLEKYDFITVEEFHGGLNSYRVLVFKNKVIGVVGRFAARVVGDGIHTIAELIDATNKKREKISDILKPIQIDKECETSLREQSLTLSSIPDDGQVVRLGYTTNTSRGGTVVSMGTKLSRKNARCLVSAAKKMNLELAGFDVLCEDIRIPFCASRGVIIEVNHSPSVRIHEDFYEGNPVKVTKTILKSLIYRHPIRYLLHRLRQPHLGLHARMVAFLLLFFSGGILLRYYFFV